MNDTARDYQTVQPATTEGLEDFFDTKIETLISEQGQSDQTTVIDEGSPDQILATPLSPDHWTLSTAAQYLQISVATIRRRLQKGNIEGYKVQGVNGPEWRIVPPAHCSPITDRGRSDQTPVIDPGDPDQAVLTTPVNNQQVVIDVLLKRLSDVEGQLQSAQKELQGAVWRNGYLESQLENEREQIKLLTDSQHKGSWWAGFKKWFLGQ